MQFGTTKSGNPSAKLKGGRGWRTYLRIRMVAIFESQGYSDIEIAMSLNITPQYVNMLKRTPEYVAAKVTAATNILSQAEKNALTDLEARRQAISDLVPDALQAIRDTLINGTQPALRLKAAQDLLDRQGDLAKVSRTEVSLPKQFDYEKQQKVTNDLMSALQSINALPQKEAEKDENITSVAGVEDFTNTALDENQQKQIQEAMKLIQEAATKDMKPQLIN